MHALERMSMHAPKRRLTPSPLRMYTAGGVVALSVRLEVSPQWGTTLAPSTYMLRVARGILTFNPSCMQRFSFS